MLDVSLVGGFSDMTEAVLDSVERRFDPVAVTAASLRRKAA